jgi:hypothetical protein
MDIEFMSYRQKFPLPVVAVFVGTRNSQLSLVGWFLHVPATQVIRVHFITVDYILLCS